jgi:hypothetical protein
VLRNQFVRCARGVLAGEWVDHNPTLGALDKRDVGNVVAANLPHAFGDHEQTMVCIQCRMAPQMWVNGVGAVATISKKLERIAVEYKTTFGVIDQAALALCNKPTLHAL